MGSGTSNIWDKIITQQYKKYINITIEEELDDMIENIKPHLLTVMRQGAEKHGVSSWKDADNPSLQHKANHASLFRHIAESSCNVEEDEDSGVHPLCHVVIRCLMKLGRENREERAQAE